MKILPLLLLGISLLPLPAAEVVTDPFPPAHFTSLYIEKDEKGLAIVIQMAGDAVTYKVTVGDKITENVTVHPAPEDWLKFIQGLNSAKVYKWAPKYDYPGQGNSWVIDLSMDDRKFTSEGNNEYPKEGAEDQPQADVKNGPSIPFQIFWQAALELVGKMPPQTAPK